MIVLYILLGKKVSEKTSFQVQKQGKDENTQNYPVYTLEHGGKERQEDYHICYVFLFCHHFEVGYGLLACVHLCLVSVLSPCPSLLEIVNFLSYLHATLSFSKKCKLV